jgi:hypothetical protein
MRINPPKGGFFHPAGIFFPVYTLFLMLYSARHGFVHCIRKAGHRHCERSEAIYASTLDCFLLRTSQDDGTVGKLYESSYPLFALLKAE